MPTLFTLRFELSQIRFWARRYPLDDDVKVEKIAGEVHARGYFTRAEFLDLCYWKSPRSKSYVERNNEEFILAVTHTALATPDERLRIEVLTLLDGVSWPTASVLLHFGHNAPYPILDYRALWSLSVEGGMNYNFDFWWEYVQACRQTAKQAGVEMRTLDRALWQYAKENQK